MAPANPAVLIVDDEAAYLEDFKSLRYLTKDRPLKEIEFAIQEGLQKYKNPHGIQKEI